MFHVNSILILLVVFFLLSSSVWRTDLQILSMVASEISNIENEDEDKYAWLQAIEAPEYLYMRSGTYTGPVVKV